MVGDLKVGSTRREPIHCQEAYRLLCVCREGVQILLDKEIQYDHSSQAHDCQPFYARGKHRPHLLQHFLMPLAQRPFLPAADEDAWTKICYSAASAESWMKPLVRGKPTGLVEIPANWYLDDLPPHMFIVRTSRVPLPTAGCSAITDRGAARLPLAERRAQLARLCRRRRDAQAVEKGQPAPPSPPLTSSLEPRTHPQALILAFATAL